MDSTASLVVLGIRAVDGPGPGDGVFASEIQRQLSGIFQRG